ncbi:unnamed protein product [Trichogramma brassicae]|uniref:Uncharacterized protein n=1 Tax=Trichogramma brassicae TaxID=86971 RepID=A0A6H5IJE0_9HYME|nr:unnamed protein product [Trichogramma brassicae]
METPILVSPIFAVNREINSSSRRVIQVDRITRLRRLAIVNSATSTCPWTIRSIHPEVPPAIPATPTPSTSKRVHGDVDAEEAGLRYLKDVQRVCKGTQIGKLKEGKLKRTKSTPRSRPKQVLQKSTPTSKNSKNRRNTTLSNNKADDKNKIEIITNDSDIIPDKSSKLKSKLKQNNNRKNTNTKMVNTEHGQIATQQDYDDACAPNKSIDEKPVENDSLPTCDRNKLENRKLANNQSKSTASNNKGPQLSKKKSK